MNHGLVGMMDWLILRISIQSGTLAGLLYRSSNMLLIPAKKRKYNKHNFKKMIKNIETSQDDTCMSPVNNFINCFGTNSIIFFLFFNFLFAFLNQTFHGLQSTPRHILAYMYTISHSHNTHTTNHRTAQNIEWVAQHLVSLKHYLFIHNNQQDIVSIFLYNTIS